MTTDELLTRERIFVVAVASLPVLLFIVIVLDAVGVIQ